MKDGDLRLCGRRSSVPAAIRDTYKRQLTNKFAVQLHCILLERDKSFDELLLLLPGVITLLTRQLAHRTIYYGWKNLTPFVTFGDGDTPSIRPIYFLPPPWFGSNVFFFVSYNHYATSGYII